MRAWEYFCCNIFEWKTTVEQTKLSFARLLIYPVARKSNLNFVARAAFPALSHFGATRAMLIFDSF